MCLPHHSDTGVRHACLFLASTEALPEADSAGSIGSVNNTH